MNKQSGINVSPVTAWPQEMSPRYRSDRRAIKSRRFRRFKYRSHVILAGCPLLSMLLSQSVLLLASVQFSFWFYVCRKLLIRLIVSIQIEWLCCRVGHMTCTDCSPLTSFQETGDRRGRDTGSSSEPQFTNWIDFFFQRRLTAWKVLKCLVWRLMKRDKHNADIRLQGVWDERHVWIDFSEASQLMLQLQAERDLF